MEDKRDDRTRGFDNEYMENENENKTNEIPAEIQSQLDEQKKIINNLTSELKEVRTKKQEAEEAAKKLLEETPSGDDTKVDISAALQVELDKRAKADAERARLLAETKFRNSISEFSPDNDPGDIKYNTFKKEMDKFNFNDLQSEEDFTTRYQEVYDFVNRSATAPQSKINQFASTTQSGFTKSDDNLGKDLNRQEQDLIKANGWSAEKYLKLKQKQPGFISQLLRS